MTEQKNDEQFYKMFLENKDRIYRLCYGSLSNKDDVDDLFQEVMINAWKNMHKFRGESKISTWLYRITVNTAILFNKKYLKKISRASNYEFEKLDNITNGEKAKINDKIEKLHECISLLKKQDRIIVSLFLEGFSYDEIAGITGITTNYVGVKLSRIKNELAKCFTEDKDG